MSGKGRDNNASDEQRHIIRDFDVPIEKLLKLESITRLTPELSRPATNEPAVDRTTVAGHLKALTMRARLERIVRRERPTTRRVAHVLPVWGDPPGRAR